MWCKKRGRHGLSYIYNTSKGWTFRHAVVNNVCSPAFSSANILQFTEWYDFDSIERMKIVAMECNCLGYIGVPSCTHLSSAKVSSIDWMIIYSLLLHLKISFQTI